MTAAEVAGVRRAVLRLLGPPGMDVLAWSMLAAVTIGTNLLDFAAIPAPGERPGAAFAVATIVRIGLIFWIGYAVSRRMAGVARPYRITAAFGRYAAYAFAMLFLYALVARIAAAGTPANVPLERQWIMLLFGSAMWAMLTIRLLAWSVALATGAPFGTLGAIWRGQAGRVLPVLLAFVALVLPAVAVHLALTLIGLRLPLSPNGTAALAVVDGAVQALELALTCALSVVAWRGAGGALRGEAGGR